MTDLIVAYEGNPNVQILLRHNLERGGYPVVFAPRPEDVLTLTDQHRPWLLIIAEDDFNVMTIGELRARLPDANTRLILTGTRDGRSGEVMSGYVNPLSNSLGKGPGIYLERPFNPNELVQILHAVREDWERAEERKTIRNTVLICADAPASQIAERVLQSDGFSVVLALGTHQVFALAAEHRPWLTVLAGKRFEYSDIPRLRAHMNDPALCVLALDVGEGCRRAEAHGADMCLTLPFNPLEPRMLVRRMREHREQEQAQSRDTHSSTD